MFALQTAASAAGDAIKVATPYAKSTLELLIAQDPAILAAGAGGLFLAYLLVPAFFSGVAYSARGYAGKSV